MNGEYEIHRGERIKTVYSCINDLTVCAVVVFTIFID